MKLKYFVLVSIGSFVLYWVTIPFRSVNFGGFPVSSLIGFIAYTYFTLLCFEKLKDKNQQILNLFAIFIGLWLLELPMRILDFQLTLTSFPDILLKSLGVVCGFLYWKLKSPCNILVIFIGCVLSVFMYFQGWIYWAHYRNFDNFTGKVSAYKLPQNIEGANKNNNKINNQTLENKIVLLDFWHTRCGVCFQKFPQLQAFYDKYKNDDSIAVFAVDKPLEEDKLQSAFKVIEEEGYNFPVLLPTDEDLPEKFGVKVYPTTFVINRQRNVVYKGDIEGAVLMAEELKRNNQ
jgi:thiol-disulfide isomerase/thioredoxin